MADVDRVIVFGANAILAWLQEVNIQNMKQFISPANISRELDLCIGDGSDNRLNTLVDGTIGELSQFDETFGIYAHPNPIEGLFQAPSSWLKRIRIEKEPNTGIKIIVPHYLDLGVSKIMAGRPKDFEFVMSMMWVFKVRAEQIEELCQEYAQEHPVENEKVSACLNTFNFIKSRSNYGNDHY